MRLFLALTALIAATGCATVPPPQAAGTATPDRGRLTTWFTRVFAAPDRPRDDETSRRSSFTAWSDGDRIRGGGSEGW